MVAGGPSRASPGAGPGASPPVVRRLDVSAPLSWPQAASTLRRTRRIGAAPGDLGEGRHGAQELGHVVLKVRDLDRSEAFYAGSSASR